MKKICLLVLGILLIGSFAQASLSRLAGMGLQNWMVDDDANIWFSPVYINDYPNRIWGELGTGGAGIGTAQWGGASLRMLWGLLGNLGIYYTRPYTGLNGVSTANVGTDPGGDDLWWDIANIVPPVVVYGGYTPVGGFSPATLAPGNKIDVFYGFKIPYLLKLGVMANYAGNYTMFEDKYDTTGISAASNGKGSLRGERSTNEFNVGAGVTLEQLGPIPQLDVIAHLGFPIVNNTYLERSWLNTKSDYRTANISLTNAGSFNLVLGGRAKLTLWDLKFIVFGGWGLNNLPSVLTDKRDSDLDSALEVDLKQERAYSVNTINAGIALNQQITDKTLVVLAFGANYVLTQNTSKETEPIALAAKNEYSWSRTTIGIPINIGIEHQLPWWGLVGRAGLLVTYQLQIPSVLDINYYANGTEFQRFTTTNPVDITVPVVMSLGLGKQITDTLSADLLLRQNANTGILNSLMTQLTLVWKFK